MTGWTCTRCGTCCTTTPFVTVSAAERAVLDGKRDGLTWEPDPKPGFWQLQARPCPFYDQGCTIYSSRPYNCRRYASLKGYTGTSRDATRVLARFQRKAQPYADAHGWHP